IEVADAEDIVFEYEPEELGLAPQHAVKIASIKQLRPLARGAALGHLLFRSRACHFFILALYLD
ncbi:MAG: hypothetical protein JXB35_18420, partial [Anaerolineae bacterium]|nr:hypothetical protein [Anaerolineae bacterium]